MDPAAIFIIVLIVAVIVIVIWFAIDLRRRRIEQIEQLGTVTTTQGQGQGAGTSQDRLGWGDPEPVPGDRGLCSLYTYPAVAPGQPAIPTLNTKVVDSLTPSEIGSVSCIDADQLALQKVNQTCEGGSVLGTFCYGSDGQQYSPGQTRQFYVECNASKCSDTIAQVGLNFDPMDFTSPPPQNTACLQFDSTDASQPITGNVCDLQSIEQIYRVERQAANGTASDDGPYGRLVDRASNLCVVPSKSPPSAGTTLQLGTCSPSNGYVWWFFPPTSVPNTTTIDGVTLPTRTIAPQQLVYYPNNNKDPPKGEALDEYIRIKNPLSMQVIVNNDGNDPNFGTTVYNQPVQMQPLSRSTKNNTNTGEVGNAANAQTIDYWLYRTISETPVTCADCGTNFTF